MKPIINNLPDSYRSLCRTYIPADNIENMYLKSAFAWMNTAEGQGFWDQCYDRLKVATNYKDLIQILPQIPDVRRESFRRTFIGWATLWELNGTRYIGQWDGKVHIHQPAKGAYQFYVTPAEASFQMGYRYWSGCLTELKILSIYG